MDYAKFRYAPPEGKDMSKNIYKFIEENVDIKSIVSRYTTLSENPDARLSNKCPICNEHTFGLKKHAFSNDERIKYFYCTTCLCSGEVIEFIMIKEKLTKLQAVFWLIDECNLTVPSTIFASCFDAIMKHFDHRIDVLMEVLKPGEKDDVEADRDSAEG